MNTNKAEVAKTRRRLFEPGDVFEIRALEVEGYPSTRCGYFNDVEKAAAAVSELPDAEGIYVTLNPANPDLLARANNRFPTKKKQKTTSDGDVLERRWILIDCDPSRPSGISATDDELRAAFDRAKQIAAWLISMGCSPPIIAVSGNGAHLLLSVRLPNDNPSNELVKAFLAAVQAEFGCDAIQIDQAVSNAARICRLYGTPARKGDSLPNRPHRLSQLIDVPASIEPCSMEALQRVASLATSADSTDNGNPDQWGGDTGNSRRLNVAEYLDHYEIPFREKPGIRNWTKFILDECPFNPDHKADDSMVAQHTNGALSFSCFHDSCRDKKWGDCKKQIGEPKPEHWGSVYESPLKPGAKTGNVDIPEKKTVHETPYRPFPTECLPEVLGDFVTESSRSIGCDDAFSALPVLAVAAASIGTSRNLEIKRGWSVPPVLWMVLVGESGSQKSPPQREATRPFKDRQAKQSEAYVRSLADYSEKLSEFKRRQKSWDRKPEGDRPEEPQRPQRGRCLISDTTIEALAPVLQENERGVLMARDELSGWLSGFDKYSQRGGTSSDAAKWLEIYGCESTQIDRKTGDEKFIFVKRPSVCICGGIQPGILQKCLGDEHKQNGLQARLLMAYPPRQPKRWRDDEPSRVVVDAYHMTIDQLFSLQPDTDSSGNTKPLLLKMDDQAKELFRDFVNQHGSEQTALHGHTAAQWSKLEEIPARLAIVLHCVEQVTRGVDDACLISADVIQKAITLTEWFKQECLRITQLMLEPEDVREARHLRDWIQSRGGAITASDLRKYRRDVQTTEQAELLLIDLARRGLGQWHDIHKSREFRLFCSEMSTNGA